MSTPANPNWLAGWRTADPGGGCSIAHAYVQVCMHSQGHRSQCATRLRSLGGKPPVTDFIVWLKDRPAPNW